MKKNLQFTIYNLQSILNFSIFNSKTTIKNLDILNSIQILKFKFQISLFLLFTFYLLLITFSGLARAASPAPSPSSLSEFQKKVEDIKKEAATKSAQIKSEVSQTIQNKAFIGNAVDVQKQQFSLQSKTGVHTVSFDQYTVFQDGSKKTTAIKDLKKDDFIIALGDVDDKQVLKARKVIRAKAPAASEKSALWGQVQSNLAGSLSLLTSDNQKVSVKTISGTVYKFGPNDIALADIKTPDFIIAIGSKLNNNSSTAQFIYLLNPKGDLTIKNASASATPSASPKKP